MPVKKSSGTTPSEKYLARLCDHTFLSLWSYPNVYRDQGTKGGTQTGKELCDLLVVCGKDIIIFSDKSCEFPNTGDVDNDWCRWYKKAIHKSARQLFGAERWLKEFPERIFLNAECSEPFPFPIDDVENCRFHRVAVALGAQDRSKEHLGGSGSLSLIPGIDVLNEEYTPFAVGKINADKGIVHVLDDTTLDIILEELDTISDFVAYLTKKEQLLEADQLCEAVGEEDLLACYLAYASAGEHAFPVPDGGDRFSVAQGMYSQYKALPEYTRKKEANRVSYLWDSIIDQFGNHALNGTLVDADGTLQDAERALRHMAREDRTSRRGLSEGMREHMMRSMSIQEIGTRSMVAPDCTRTTYIYTLIPRDYGSLKDECYDYYRGFRRAYLQAYCFVFAWRHKTIERIIGIATESGHPVVSGSHDLVFMQHNEWTHKDEEYVQKALDFWGFQQELNMSESHCHVDEYPSLPEKSDGAIPVPSKVKPKKNQREIRQKRKDQRKRRKAARKRR